MISERAKRIKPSPTLAMDAKAKAMKAEGIDVVNLGVGEPDFDTPANIKESAIKAIKEGKTKYTPVGGIEPLKDAIIEKFKKDNDLDYTRDEIIVSCGGKHSLYNIFQAILSHSDEVIIPSPYWVSYPEQVLLNDGVPVFVKTYEKDSFMLKPDVLSSHITKKTRAIIINSPSNPTGSTYDEKTLSDIGEIALKHNLYIISDEIYEKLLYDGIRHISIASFGKEIKERTLVVNGLSKVYAMTGWRIGYTGGPKELIKAMTNIQSQSTSNPTSIAQWAGVEALRGTQDFIEKMVAEFDKRRRFLVDELNSIKGVTCLKPTGAFYAFPNVSGLYRNDIKTSDELSLYLLERARVALVPGSAFGDDSFIRLSYATSMDEIRKGIGRIKEAVEKLSV